MESAEWDLFAFQFKNIENQRSAMLTILLESSYPSWIFFSDKSYFPIERYEFQ